ncbi:hypothetical protein XENTR_v10024592 [Xenopus tropicalis]|nr:hypothetical protein XENTR_v10024592 [Xenopus tropicalis]
MAKLFQIIFILFFLIVFLCLAPISAVKIENVTLFGEKIQLEPNTWSIIPCHFIPRSPIKNNKISLEWDKEESGAYIPVIQLAGIKMRTVSLRDNRFKVFKDLVHKGNCSLIIDSTKLTDSGSYQLRLTVGGKLFKPFPRIQVQIEETKKFKQGTWHVPHRHLGTKNRKIPISDNRKLSAELDSEASDEKNEEKPSRTEAKWSTGLIAGVASACCVVVLITVITCVVYCYRKKRKEEVQAQDEESLSNLNEVETKEVEVPEPQGFPNLGNTCYMNATLQCLHSVQPFVSDLLKQKIPKKTTQFAFIRNLSSLLERKDTCSVKKRTALLLKLKDSLSDSAERFAENNQHDAHDFLSECFNLIKENIENLSRISKNPITCPVKSNFEFEMENIYTCKK